MEGPGGEEQDGLVVAAGEIAAISASLSSAARRPSGMITPSSQGVIQRRNVRGGGMDNSKKEWTPQSTRWAEAGKRGPQGLPRLSNTFYAVSRATRRGCGNAPARFRQEALNFVEE